jgi:hypothetical protein
MTKITTKYGMFGVAAIVAILTVSLIVANVAQEVDAVSLPAKKGYTGGDGYIGISEERGDATGTGGEMIISEFYFKTNSGGDLVFDLTAECATATHIQGKSSKKNTWEGAQVDASVWFEVDYAGDEFGWLRVPFKGEATLPTESEAAQGVGEWNICGQTFEIKTNLNYIIEEVEDEEGNISLQFACSLDVDEDGIPNEEDEDYVFNPECEQFIDLFLVNAGTHTAKAVLKNVPNGVHEARAMAYVTVVDQESLEETGAVGDGIRQTSLTFGNRLLILEDIQIIEAHEQ